MKFSDLKPYQQKDILTSLLIDGMSYEQIEQEHGIKPEQIAELINERAVKPYNQTYKATNEDETIHQKTVWGWIKNGLFISVACYLVVVLVQSFLGGFESQIITDSVAYITQPLAKVVNLGIAVAFIVFALHQFFPILAIFINEKVNTVSLKDTFLKASANTKLIFLALVVLALSLLTGLVFSAKAQTKRACIIQTASKEVGTLEKGGNNRGARIDTYRSVSQNRTIKGGSDAWCGYFVDFVFKSCNISIKGVRFPPRARDWFQDATKIVWRKNFQYGVLKKPPQSGDLIGYQFRSGNIGHIEILKEWHEDYFISIGGNTSATNTVYRDADKLDGVRLKKRNISTAFVIANWID